MLRTFLSVVKTAITRQVKYFPIVAPAFFWEYFLRHVQVLNTESEKPRNGGGKQSWRDRAI